VSLDQWEKQVLPLMGETATVVFTSKHAVTSLTDGDLQSFGKVEWQVYCLDGATKAAVHDRLPEATIRATADSAAELAEKIITDGVKEAIFFCGDHRRDELPQLLSSREIKLQEVIVYKTEPVPVQLGKEYAAVLFFSPSAVESFFNQHKLSKDAACFAIGETTASAIRERTKNEIITCSRPAETEMLNQVNDYLGKKKLKNA
jgi:uroporphyrinogen-III synthase